LKNHIATIEEAQKVVQPFIEAWELSVALDPKRKPGDFRLSHKAVKIVDRSDATPT
jgi:hypothetical protein